MNTITAIAGATPLPAEGAGIAKQSELHLRSILCPVDLSEFSQNALLYATGLGRHFGSRVYVQHTVQPGVSYLGGPDVSPVMLDAQAQISAAREEVRRMLLAAQVDLAEVTLLLDSGDFFANILRAEVREHIDLLVMGSHGHRGFTRLVMGSNAESMIHKSACPVLVVSRPPEGSSDRQIGRAFKSMVLATDFSAHSDRALAMGLKWAHEFGARLTVLHCVEKTPPEMQGLTDLFPEYNPYFEKQLARAWERIEHLVPAEERRNVPVINEVRHGTPREEILRVAREKNAGLVIAAARGTSKVSPPWGSVSSAVVRNGEVPVLIVPAAVDRT